MSAWSANVTVATLPNELQLRPHMWDKSPIQTVPASPVQIRAHHHIYVYTEINNAQILIS